MHRARSRVLVPPEAIDKPKTAKKINDGASGSVVVGETCLQSISVTVVEPSTDGVENGRFEPFGLESTGIGAELYLTPSSLCYSIETIGVCEFLLEDILGVQVSPTASMTDSKACEFNLHLFLVTSAPRAKRKVRKRCTSTILFDSGQSFAENLQLASQWKTAVLLQTQSAVESTFGEPGMQREGHNGSLVRKKFLVFINPVAGTRRGTSLFSSEVKPMLDLAEIDCVEIVTERQNHAREVIKSYGDLEEIDAIILCSGDGLLYEVINGIMERKDWEQAIKTPIGMLPTGSGNALCASTLYESDEEYGLAAATFQIIRGGVAPLDVATVQFGDGTSTYMSLLTSWGFVSDTDIESERFRILGEARFYLGALISILRKRVYRGRLSYIVTEGETSKEGGEENSSLPLKRNTESNTGTGTSKSPLRPSTDLLVPLDRPLPQTWTTEEAGFLSVTPVMVPLMTNNFFSDPDVSTGSGSFRLVWINGDITRKGVLDVVTGAETGRHLELEGVHRRSGVGAFRLEPLTPPPPGMMTVDGEVVPYGPLQAQVHPHLARVISRRRRKKSRKE